MATEEPPVTPRYHVTLTCPHAFSDGARTHTSSHCTQVTLTRVSAGDEGELALVLVRVQALQ